MKKFTFLGLGIAALALVGCKTTTSEPVPVNDQTLALQSATALSLMGDLKVSDTSIQNKLNLTGDPVDPDSIPVETLDVIASTGAEFTVEHLESDREGYTKLEKVSFTVSDELTASYLLYYNDEAACRKFDDEVQIRLNSMGGSGEPMGDGETCDGSKLQTNRDDGKGRGQHGKYDTKYQGLAVVGEEEYRFVAQTETDFESDEQESELKFVLIKDQLNYTIVRQEYEVEGTLEDGNYQRHEKFVYRVVTDGVETKKFVLKLEAENNTTEYRINLDGVTYRVSYLTEGENNYIIIHVDGVDYKYLKVVVTDPDTGETSITYEKVA
jgi:hypothetical protein